MFISVNSSHIMQKNLNVQITWNNIFNFILRLKVKRKAYKISIILPKKRKRRSWIKILICLVKALNIILFLLIQVLKSFQNLTQMSYLLKDIFLTCLSWGLKLFHGFNRSSKMRCLFKTFQNIWVSPLHGPNIFQD